MVRWSSSIEAQNDVWIISKNAGEQTYEVHAAWVLRPRKLKQERLNKTFSFTWMLCILRNSEIHVQLHCHISQINLINYWPNLITDLEIKYNGIINI